jgi:hypothetical protein
LEQTKSNKEEKTTYKLEIDITNPTKQRGKKKTRGGGKRKTTKKIKKTFNQKQTVLKV